MVTGQYQIQPSNESLFALELRKTGLVRGKKNVLFFERYSGDVQYAHEKPEGFSIRLEVETKSGVCRDEGLKPADRRKVVSSVVNAMMAADQYPQLAFAATRMVPRGPNRFEIQGTLTIKDVAKPVNVDVAITPSGQDRIELDGQGQISLKDFGLKPPASALGLVRTKNTMQLRFLLWAEKAG